MYVARERFLEARLLEEEIERLKGKMSLEGLLVQSAGVQMLRHGADLLGRCPLHDDREQSLVVSPEKALWRCLGFGQAVGSVIDWV